MSIFDKWNEAIDPKKYAEEVKEIEKNGGDYEDVPHGEYEVKIDKMELRESRKGDPMFSVTFKIVSGEHKNRLIFMNQVVLQPFQIHIVNEFLRSLETPASIDFDGNYSHWNDLIFDIMEQIDGKCEFLLDYGENQKGYNTFKIKEIYDV